jgi:hypothetical protein
MTKRIERRKRPRFKPILSTVAECQGARNGIIADISMDGLSFNYYNFGFQEKKRPRDKSLQVSVSHFDYTMVENLPCKIVNDLALRQSQKNRLITIRKCCLQFGALAPSQKEQLEYFIHNCASLKHGPRQNRSVPTEQTIRSSPA